MIFLSTNRPKCELSKWYFLEYLADEMHIIEELTLRDFNNSRAIMRARFDYLDDASKINI